MTPKDMFEHAVKKTMETYDERVEGQVPAGLRDDFEAALRKGLADTFSIVDAELTVARREAYDDARRIVLEPRSGVSKAAKLMMAGRMSLRAAGEGVPGASPKDGE